VITGVAEAAGGAVAGDPPTVICICEVFDPDLLVAVNTYVVVVAGTTLSVPVAATEGIPGSILTLDAFSTSHDRIEASPMLIEVGLAANLTILGNLLSPPKSIVMHPPVAINNTRAIRSTFLIKRLSLQFLLSICAPIVSCFRQCVKSTYVPVKMRRLQDTQVYWSISKLRTRTGRLIGCCLLVPQTLRSLQYLHRRIQQPFPDKRPHIFMFGDVFGQGRTEPVVGVNEQPARLAGN
jgi:hypothetical protein